MPYENESRFQIDDGAGGWNTLNEGEFSSYRHIKRKTGLQELSLTLDLENETLLSGDVEVRLQRYDPSDTNGDGSEWETVFAGFTRSGGEITADGTINLVCDDYLIKVIDEKVDIDQGTGTASSTDNTAVMAAIFSGLSDFTVTTVNADSFGLSKYTYSGARRDAVMELVRNYDQALYLEPDNTDYASPGGGTHEIIYETDGFTSSGETLDSSDSDEPITIIRWEKDRQVRKVQDVRVIGTDANGDPVQGTNTGGSPPFERVQVGYVKSDAEAEDIANQIAEPSGEGGRVSVAPWFLSNLVNETIDLVDNLRNINGTFQVIRQVNSYPEGRTELELGYSEEDEGVGELSKRERELRAERARRITRTTTNVGAQGLTSADTGSAPSDTDVTGSINNSVIPQGSNSNQTQDPSLSTGGGILDCDVSAPFVSGNGDVNLILVTVAVDNNSSSADGWDLKIENTTQSDSYFFEANFIAGDNLFGIHSTAVFVQGDIEGDNIRARLRNWSDQSDAASLSCAVTTLAEHTHGDTFVTNDNNHGGSGDEGGSHGVSGNTDDKDVELATEDQDDR